jgi:hypothetical protein
MMVVVVVVLVTLIISACVFNGGCDLYPHLQHDFFFFVLIEYFASWCFAPNGPMTPTSACFSGCASIACDQPDPLQGSSGLILEFSLLDEFPSLRASSARDLDLQIIKSISARLTIDDGGCCVFFLPS